MILALRSSCLESGASSRDTRSADSPWTNQSYLTLTWHCELTVCVCVCVYRWCLAVGLTRGRACRGLCLWRCLRRWTDSLEFPSSVLLHHSTATSNSLAPPSPTLTASLDPEGETGVHTPTHLLRYRQYCVYGTWKQKSYDIHSVTVAPPNVSITSHTGGHTHYSVLPHCVYITNIITSLCVCVCVCMCVGHSCLSVRSAALLKPTLHSVKNWWTPWWRTLRWVLNAVLLSELMYSYQCTDCDSRLWVQTGSQRSISKLFGCVVCVHLCLWLCVCVCV